VGEEVGGGGEDQPGRRVGVLSVIGQQAWHFEVTGDAREVGGLDQSAGSPARMRAESPARMRPATAADAATRRRSMTAVSSAARAPAPDDAPRRQAGRAASSSSRATAPSGPVRSGPVADSTRCHTRGSGDSVSAATGEWCALPRSLRDALCTIAARTSRWRNDTCPTASSTCAR
jgi:hypothetical protein